VRRLYKYGLVVIRDNKLLLCEPYAFADLILPGGTKEGKESHIENLLREIQEELGPQAILDVGSLKYVGNFEDLAAGRSDTTVEIELYSGSLSGALEPSTEIKGLHWFSLTDDRSKLSAIIRNKILPYLIKNNFMSDSFASEN